MNIRAMSKGHIEVDCNRRCRSKKHGQSITSAITKRSVTDEALASYIKALCANFTHAFDFEGRTAIHMSSSRGRKRLMEWLVKHSSEAFVNARDRESGYTPLHRSIFYGQIHIAVALMKIGVNIDIIDKDDYRALEHAMLDRQYMYKHEGTQPCDVYVWGSNSNYTLGTGTQQQKKTPDPLSCFSRNNTSVKQVCLGKFHSVWVCAGAEGDAAWCCGQLGRAGGGAVTALRPVALRTAEPCLQVAVTVSSTVLLLQSGAVVQYTLSTADASASQSASKPFSSVKLPSVKPLLKLSRPLGVCASRVHAAVWNARAVHTWGDNVGQLGHSPEERRVDVPRRVAISMNINEEAGIDLVGVSDAATVITTSRGDVYLLHKHICKKIAIKQINLRQVCVDAKVNEHGVYSRVTVLLLTNVGQLMLWQDTTNKLTRCVFGLSHQISITHVALTHDAVFLTTKYGEAYSGSISRSTSSVPVQCTPKKERDNRSALVKFLEKDDCTSVRITRIANVHRAVSISVDSEGLNFACLQIKPTCGLTSLPELSPSSMCKHMETLLDTTSEDDILHDVVFKVGLKLYPAHIFVIASGSEHLYKLYQDAKLSCPDDTPTIVLDTVLPDVFDRILRYLYTGRCDVTELGPCGLKIRKEDLIGVKKERDAGSVEADVIENPTEVSAFEVYKSQSEKSKKGNRRTRSTDTPPRAHPFCDPVKLVQAAAKRLHVGTLHKLLDKFYYQNGSICLKESSSSHQNLPPCWDRDSAPELVDTSVRCRDGATVAAHRCVLAARLDYFHGMFTHSWTESKQLSTVSLPINHSILLPVINFLYTDKCPEVESSDNIDFICSLLVVADQLFITRLREMCEKVLGNLVTLKNCAELCQFAHTYNALQLKQCCMEFISLNIASVLENRALDLLDENLIEDITKYYCKFNPIMSSRVITPFYNAPSDETIEEFARNNPVDLLVVDEEYLKEEVVEISKKRNKNYKKIEYTESEKARMRYESVSSVNSLDLSHDTSGDITLSLSKLPKDTEKGARDKQEKWVEVPTTAQQKHHKVVQARLKAISSAKDILNEQPVESFTTLSKSTSFSSHDNSLPTTSRMSVSPKDSYNSDIPQSPQGNIVISHIGPKLSQKQRKKLESEGRTSLDRLLNDKQVISPQAKPKNAWKICEQPACSSTPKSKPVGFEQILADQKKQKDDSSRIMTKPLLLTQMEDKAIEDLERFYNVHELDDEFISVRRIELQVASPQWLHTASK